MYEEAKSDGRISGTSQHTGGPIIISLAAEVMDQDASLIKQAQRLLSNDAVQKQMSGVRKQREFEPVSDFLPRHAARLVGRQAMVRDEIEMKTRWPRVKEKYSGAGAMSIQEYYDRYIELTRYVPEAFRHQHFVSEALVDRVRNAQNLHWKARGREDLHDVTMDELLANISKEYDKKHQTHEALRGHVPFSDTSGLPSVTVGCRVQGSRGSGENRSATTA